MQRRAMLWIAAGFGFHVLSRLLWLICETIVTVALDGGGDIASVLDQIKLWNMLGVGAMVVGGIIMLVGVVRLRWARPRVGLTVALVGCGAGLLLSLWLVGIMAVPSLQESLRGDAWQWLAAGVRVAEVGAWVLLAIAGQELARESGRPLGNAAVGLLGASLVVLAALPLVGYISHSAAWHWTRMIAGALAPLPSLWLFARRYAEAPAAPRAAPPGGSNPRLSEAIGLYRGGIIARLWVLVSVAGLTILAVLARSRGVIVAGSVLGALADLGIAVTLIVAAVRIAEASDESGRLYGWISAVAQGAGLILGLWLLWLTFQVLGVDENSSYSAINRAMDAQKLLPSLTTAAQIVAMVATLPLIGAVHLGLARAGAEAVAQTTALTVAVVTCGGLGAIAVRVLLEPRRAGVGALLGIAVLALAAAVTVCVVYLTYLGRARDALAEPQAQLPLG